ncbi:hypothetical protein TGAMA5MH_04176 [Trichoderma gamsii]|uniref:C2H2-type domain-containing protein n=1 Tax=Trichoderma gamsii TaxID=398673 RepID=A0A2K0TED6_9HYPO|nr:hypothetical protein TGAMA5MH_04176 [Trichoderma gamsii]
MDTDRHLPNATPETLKADATPIGPSLEKTLEAHGAETVTRLCDYSGVRLAWSPGPRNSSLESIYQLVVKGDRIAYHANPNVCLIASSLNFAKRRHPAIFLPLIAEWLNIHDEEKDFTARKSRWAWVFNALSNVAILEYIFFLTSTHVNQINAWETWTPAQQKEVLEVLRTGTKRPIVDEFMSGILPRELFHHTKEPYTGALSTEIAAGRVMLQTLIQIGQLYGITPHEFDYYLTIPAPGRPDKVFYPFHVLSRPLSQANNWDWTTLIALARHLARNLKTQCNKHAEKDGFGEASLNHTTLIYWMAAYFSDQIVKIKMARPKASMEEIRFHMLDRWSFPRVPWDRHGFKMSLCKRTHGTAMMFGFTNTDGEEFDPSRHINLQLSTVEVDSGITNLTMLNYDDSNWDWIRSTLRRVPMYHSVWRPDMMLGDNVWSGPQDASITPRRPQPSFDMSLLPIDDWFSSTSQDVLHQQCPTCLENFSSIGLLLQHCREKHSSGGWQIPMDIPDDQQDAIDKDFWDKRFRCPICNASFKSKQGMQRHEKAKHSDEKPFKCDEDGCDAAFAFKDYLTTHKRSKHLKERLHKCNECTASFFEKGGLEQHQATVHRKERNFKCDECGRDFGTAGDRKKHISEVHLKEKPHVCEKCGAAFARKTYLNTHQRKCTGNSSLS